MPALPDAAKVSLDAGLAFIDRAIHEAGEPAIAEFLFREFVAIDIPYVPDSVEAMTIDPFVKPWIDRLVKQIHAKVHRDPAPVTQPTT